MTLQQVLFIVLAAAVLVLAGVLFAQGRRRRSRRRTPYVEALYALIDGRRDDALNLLKRAVRSGETDPDAYLQLGNLLRERRQPDKALQIHRGLAVRRDLVFEEEKEIQLAIADDLAALGKLDKAIQTLEAVSRRKRDADILRSLHAMYHRAGMYDRAFSTLRDIGKTDPSIDRDVRAGYLAAVASDRLAAGKKDEARRYIDRARRESGESIPALWLAGRIALDRGDMKEAAAAWNALLSRDAAAFRDVLPLLEKALYESGRFEDLERILMDLVRRHPANAGIIAALARFHEKKGEIDEAIAVLEEDPSVTRDPAAGTQLALLYLEIGRIDDLGRVLRRIDGKAGAASEIRCTGCGAHAEIPHRYCPTCSGIDTFERHENNTI